MYWKKTCPIAILLGATHITYPGTEPGRCCAICLQFSLKFGRLIILLSIAVIIWIQPGKMSSKFFLNFCFLVPLICLSICHKEPTTFIRQLRHVFFLLRVQIFASCLCCLNAIKFWWESQFIPWFPSSIRDHRQSYRHYVTQLHLKTSHFKGRDNVIECHQNSFSRSLKSYLCSLFVVHFMPTCVYLDSILQLFCSSRP
jgi:hypothetical protein